MKTVIIAIMASTLLAGTAQAQSNLPFTPVIEANGVIYLSGQLGYDPETRKLVPGGIEGQTRQTLDNIKSLLDGVGAKMADVVRCQVFLADAADFRAMNSVYRTYFPTLPPARTTVATALVAPEAKIEIECTAVRGHSATTPFFETKEP